MTSPCATASTEPIAGGPWRGSLRLHYGCDGDRTTAHDAHEGPLRVLKRLYPEGPAVCHHVLVHPPGGIVGGDQLEVAARLDAGAHALMTTAGATRFYRSAGAAAVQSISAQVAAGARLEWLPLETIAHDGCIAENRLRFELSPGAEMIGWDVLALGLPASGQGYERGRYLQHLELPGCWLERGLIEATDRRLLDSPLGWAGRTVMATAWIAAGSALAARRRDELVEAARAAADSCDGSVTAGVSSPHEEVIVLRALAHRVEPAMALLAAVRAAWRCVAWSLPANPPRVWVT